LLSLVFFGFSPLESSESFFFVSAATDTFFMWSGSVTEPLPGTLSKTMTRVQHTLFDIGGELSIPSSSLVTQDQVTDLESRLDELNEDLPPLKDFVLPGGSHQAAVCHLARSVCRRLERSLFAVSDGYPVSPISLQYVNRLSDLLFVIARALNRTSGATDVLWEHDRHPD